MRKIELILWGTMSLQEQPSSMDVIMYFLAVSALSSQSLTISCLNLSHFSYFEVFKYVLLFSSLISKEMARGFKMGYISSLFFNFFDPARSLNCPGWTQTGTLLASASQSAAISTVCHHSEFMPFCPSCRFDCSPESLYLPFLTGKGNPVFRRHSVSAALFIPCSFLSSHF